MLSPKLIVLITIVLPALSATTTIVAQDLTAQYDKNSQTISVFRNGTDLLLTQHVEPGTRPYIHPIMAPDGNGVLTEVSPAHHRHQTGLYWGLKKVNGRDYFMNWKEDYWRKISAKINVQRGSNVKWQSVYSLLDEVGDSILIETQNWEMQEVDGRFIIDLEWRGKARKHIVIEKFYVGGLFLRMPWHNGIDAEVINSEGQKNADAELQHARWTDIGLSIEGRNDHGHIVIFEHPSNVGFPNAWRVDNEFGVGPSRQISGDWSIMQGKSEVMKYRLIVYTGEFKEDIIRRLWKEYAGK
jgi:hypothetical protein